MGKKYGFFHFGKNKIKIGKRDKPLTSTPNTYMDTYRKKNGRFHSRRKFGADGNAYVDLDVATQVHPEDHAHDIDVTNKEQPRSELRPLTRKERREINKAKRKRRFWNNGK